MAIMKPMPKNNEFLIRFWGVRGTIPVPGASTLRYGGNTSCVELCIAGQSIILDAGSGIKSLGDALVGKCADILLSHTHIDHVLGLPFFAPAYDASCQLDLWAGHLAPGHTLRETVGRLMSSPLFPLTPDDFKAAVQYHDFTSGEALSSEAWSENGIAVTTLPLNHPDRATGYRIEQGGRSVCYITDYEHPDGGMDEKLVQFVRRADVLIYDSTYSDEEFKTRKGWGHSTWQQGVRTADAAGVKTLVVFHHNPDSTDAVLDGRAAELEAMRPGSLMAREGLEIRLNPA